MIYPFPAFGITIEKLDNGDIGVAFDRLIVAKGKEGFYDRTALRLSPQDAKNLFERLKIALDDQMDKPQKTSHKRYMAFAGANYYPCGGWNDFIGFFDTVEEAKEAARGDWRQVIDTETMEVCDSKS